MNDNIREYKSGDTIIREGDLGKDFFLLIEGEVEISRHGEEFARVSDGAIIGLFAALLDSPRNATVTALSPCRVLVVSEGTIEEFIETHPAAVVKTLRDLAQVILELDEKYLALKRDPILAAVQRTLKRVG